MVSQCTNTDTKRDREICKRSNTNKITKTEGFTDTDTDTDTDTAHGHGLEQGHGHGALPNIASSFSQSIMTKLSARSIIIV